MWTDRSNVTLKLVALFSLRLWAPCFLPLKSPLVVDLLHFSSGEAHGTHLSEATQFLKPYCLFSPQFLDGAEH